MMTHLKLTLEGRDHPVNEPTFGKIKKITPLFNSAWRKIMAAGAINEIPYEALEDATEIFSLLLDVSATDIDAMHINLAEALHALEQSSQILGFTVAKQGEMVGGGTNSTSTS